MERLTNFLPELSFQDLRALVGEAYLINDAARARHEEDFRKWCKTEEAKKLFFPLLRRFLHDASEGRLREATSILKALCKAEVLKRKREIYGK